MLAGSHDELLVENGMFTSGMIGFHCGAEKGCRHIQIIVDLFHLSRFPSQKQCPAWWGVIHVHAINARGSTFGRLLNKKS